MPPAPSAADFPVLIQRRRLALLVVCSLISLIGIFTLDACAGRHDKGGPLLSMPFWLPYLFVILRSRSEKPKKLKSGFALSVAMGCAMFPPAAWLIWYAHSWNSTGWIQAGLALIALVQLPLIVAGLRGWRSLPREYRDWQIVIANGAYAAIALLILATFLWNAPGRIERLR